MPPEATPSTSIEANKKPKYQDIAADNWQNAIKDAIVQAKIGYHWDAGRDYTVTGDTVTLSTSKTSSARPKTLDESQHARIHKNLIILYAALRTLKDHGFNPKPDNPLAVAANSLIAAFNKDIEKRTAKTPLAADDRSFETVVKGVFKKAGIHIKDSEWQNVYYATLTHLSPNHTLTVTWDEKPEPAQASTTVPEGGADSGHPATKLRRTDSGISDWSDGSISTGGESLPDTITREGTLTTSTPSASAIVSIMQETKPISSLWLDSPMPDSRALVKEGAQKIANGEDPEKGYATYLRAQWEAVRELGSATKMPKDEKEKRVEEEKKEKVENKRKEIHQLQAHVASLKTTRNLALTLAATTAAASVAVFVTVPVAGQVAGVALGTLSVALALAGVGCATYHAHAKKKLKKELKKAEQETGIPAWWYQKSTQDQCTAIRLAKDLCAGKTAATQLMEKQFPVGLRNARLVTTGVKNKVGNDIPILRAGAIGFKDEVTARANAEYIQQIAKESGCKKVVFIDLTTSVSSSFLPLPGSYYRGPEKYTRKMLGKTAAFLGKDEQGQDKAVYCQAAVIDRRSKDTFHWNNISALSADINARLVKINKPQLSEIWNQALSFYQSGNTGNARSEISDIVSKYDAISKNDGVLKDPAARAVLDLIVLMTNRKARGIFGDYTNKMPFKTEAGMAAGPNGQLRATTGVNYRMEMAVAYTLLCKAQGDLCVLMCKSGKDRTGFATDLVAARERAGGLVHNVNTGFTLGTGFKHGAHSCPLQQYEGGVYNGKADFVTAVKAAHQNIYQQFASGVAQEVGADTGGTAGLMRSAVDCLSPPYQTQAKYALSCSDISEERKGKLGGSPGASKQVKHAMSAYVVRTVGRLTGAADPNVTRFRDGESRHYPRATTFTTATPGAAASRDTTGSAGYSAGHDTAPPEAMRLIEAVGQKSNTGVKSDGNADPATSDRPLAGAQPEFSDTDERLLRNEFSSGEGRSQITDADAARLAAAGSSVLTKFGTPLPTGSPATGVNGKCATPLRDTLMHPMEDPDVIKERWQSLGLGPAAK